MKYVYWDRMGGTKKDEIRAYELFAEYMDVLHTVLDKKENVAIAIIEDVLQRIVSWVNEGAIRENCYAVFMMDILMNKNIYSIVVSKDFEKILEQQLARIPSRVLSMTRSIKHDLLDYNLICKTYWLKWFEKLVSTRGDICKESKLTEAICALAFDVFESYRGSVSEGSLSAYQLDYEVCVLQLVCDILMHYIEKQEVSAEIFYNRILSFDELELEIKCTDYFMDCPVSQIESVDYDEDFLDDFTYETCRYFEKCRREIFKRLK